MITKDNMYEWLGDVGTLYEAVDVLVGLVNNDYTLEAFKDDVSEYLEDSNTLADARSRCI